MTEFFAWFTAVAAVGAVLGSPGPVAGRAVEATVLLVTLGWWASRRAVGSWWLVAIEALAVTLGCFVLPTPEPMLGFLFGATTRRAAAGRLGPYASRAAPAFTGYLVGALWALLVDNGGEVDPQRLGPSLTPLLGLVIGTLALGDTVSAVGTARAALRTTEAAGARLDAILRNSPVALVVLDPADSVERCNDKARALFEWTGVHHEMPCPHHPDAARCPHGCLDRIREQRTGEWVYRPADGQTRTVTVEAGEMPATASVTAERGLLLAFVDISERKALEDKLRDRAERDDLTGVGSRAHLTGLLGAALARAKAGLLLIDLDDFKDVNDTHGHPTGDDCLIAVAKQIERAVADAGVVGRLGGDEFAVLVETADEATLIGLGERVLATLGETVPVAGRQTVVRASIGAALAGGDDRSTAAILLRDADTAMYVAKRAGGNRVELFHQGLRTALLARQQAEADLRQALAEEQFVLFYQPIVDLHTGRVVSAEALIRWHHPEKGLLPPGPVVEVAEETGLIVPLGDWALVRACHQAAEWATEGFTVRVSVNVSARQLHTVDFVDSVAAALHESGLLPDRLTLELTESALIRPAALTLLRQVRELGVHVALDDFGTGYSSLSYLQRHPFDLIKIDRSFIGQLGTAPTAEGIVECVLQLAAVLDTPVVAEGVETQSQADFLAGAGCPLAQGYHFSRPVPAVELRTLLHTTNK
ncbi:putative bifunctional diguanylate cyclase/phosphodiesterase [Actinophytocola sp.]|uniref:putative bifunctional diguanylate cyclase/phosphodiesterase n=1 Tax=Actinophytocola sp. TaxID=1872138 RepID=UPI002D4D7E50|nr:EAL domain-containing protein [Actinophytocola sp.]HYQ62053.1 EAL domain-containing protein [Actinophytocola sp.]